MTSGHHRKSKNILFIYYYILRLTRKKIISALIGSRELQDSGLGFQGHLLYLTRGCWGAADIR